jgi:putative ABC transport system permease protein
MTTRLRELLARLRDRFQRDRLSAELDEELRHHRALLARDGVPERSIGNVTYYKEETRTMWSLGLADDLLHDVRYAARVLRRDVGFTAAVVLTLALGIGANTAAFSIVNAVLLRPLPYREPERLISVWTGPVGSPSDRNPTSLPDLRDWAQQAKTVSGLAGYAFNRFDIAGTNGDYGARAIQATGSLYDVLGATPLLGRMPRPDEEGAPVLAISYRIWKERYGGASDVLGKPIVMNHQPYTIIGVMPAGFHFPSPDIDLWGTLYSIMSMPNATQNPWLTSRALHGYRVVARLAPGATARQAEVELGGIEQRLGAQFPEAAATLIHVQSVTDDAVRGVSRGLWTVFGAAGLILLLACVNAAHLLLERMAARTRELAVRRALGADRGRVLRQLATESVVLGLVGGVVGVAFAYAAMRALLGLAPADMPRLETVALDLPTLGFALGASLVAALLFGVAPALVRSERDVHATLRAQGKGAAGGVHGNRARAWLMMLEVAFAVVILVGAGLMLRSFAALTASPLGVQPDNVVVAQLTVTGTRYQSGDAKTQAVEQVLENIRAIPGVTVAGASTSMPPSRIQQGEGFSVVGEPAPQPGHEPSAIFIPATRGFIEALRVAVIRGRTFDTRDDAASAPVVVISRELARRYFTHSDPIGRQLLLSSVPCTIIGVVDDVVYEGVGSPIRPVVYVPFAQNPFAGVWIAMRTTAAPATLTAPLRDAFHRVDPELSTRAPVALETMVSESVVRPRFNAWILSSFGALALLLACVGVYGVIAYAVAQRRAEIGIRIALGAPSGSVVSTVLRSGMAPVLVGLVVGLVSAIAASRIVAGLLYGIAPTDALTYVIVTLVLLAAAVAAGFLPARRAARVDPLIAMRGD